MPHITMAKNADEKLIKTAGDAAVSAGAPKAVYVFVGGSAPIVVATKNTELGPAVDADESPATSAALYADVALSASTRAFTAADSVSATMTVCT